MCERFETCVWCCKLVASCLQSLEGEVDESVSEVGGDVKLIEKHRPASY